MTETEKKSSSDAMGIFESLSDVELLTLCLWGEARGEPAIGKLAVAHVVLNRAAAPCWWGKTIKEVILKPKQFSCFNANDLNRHRLEHQVNSGYYDPACLAVAQLALSGKTEDPTGGGATHYCTVDCRPSWESEMEFLVRINRHRFFRAKTKTSATKAGR